MEDMEVVITSTVVFVVMVSVHLFVLQIVYHLWLIYLCDVCTVLGPSRMIVHAIFWLLNLWLDCSILI